MTKPVPSILVVDDEVDTCANLSDILTDYGYEVSIAHDGLTALEMVRRRPFDVALLDLRMPGMDGLTLYREIKKLREGTVAIVLTAYATSATAAEAMAAGAWQVLPKPIDLPQLLGYIGEVVDRPLVLVVDDDPDLCANVRDLLQERGYRVCVAHDENQAAERLREHRFQVVLIDMRLPSGDGISVYRLVRQTDPDTRTLVISGFRSEMEETIQQLLQAGADGVCYKPFDMPQFLGLLEQLTRKRAGADEVKQ